MDADRTIFRAEVVEHHDGLSPRFELKMAYEDRDVFVVIALLEELADGMRAVAVSPGVKAGAWMERVPL